MPAVHVNKDLPAVANLLMNGKQLIHSYVKFVWKCLPANA